MTGIRARRCAAVAFIASFIASGAVVGAGASQPDVPQPGTSSQLQAVTCVASSNCWSVGGYFNGTGEVNEALHWNGSKWSKVTTPNPAGTGSMSNNVLFGVACTASNNCWAVGHAAHGVELNEALHWNGTKWASVAVPNPAGSNPGAFNFLNGVTCASASNCWAVGEFGVFLTGGETIYQQALHWNGHNWSQVMTPQPGGTALNDASSLAGVRCPSPTNCWAVGTYGFLGSPQTLLNEALHWNGSTWSQITTPNPDGTGANAENFLSGVACTSASDCWATGAYGAVTPESTTLLNQALHWDGAQWSLVDTPDPDGTGGQQQLNGVTCVVTTNCWAVGTYGFVDTGGMGVVIDEVLHWNGTKWSLVNTPNPGGLSDGDLNVLEGVRCTSASNCFAVGDTAPNGSSERNQALRWNGQHWSTT